MSLVKKALEKALNRADHTSWCPYGENSPAGDYCNCELTAYRTQLREALLFLEKQEEKSVGRETKI